jgi:hypothetical protein
MKCVVIQESWVPHEDAVYDRTGNIFLTRLMGADSRIVPDGFDIGIRKSWEDAIQSVKDAGGKPYPIPAGASVHKYGGLGYVGFAEEVRAQEKQMAVSRATWRRRRPGSIHEGGETLYEITPGPAGVAVIGIILCSTISRSSAYTLPIPARGAGSRRRSVPASRRYGGCG